MTIILIMHFMEEAATADRIFVMEGGKIIKIGTPREIFSDVKEIKRLGLDVPVAVELAARLKLKKKILTSKEFIDALSRK